MSTTKKLKVLCLHGYYQNAFVFSNKTFFKKYFKQQVDFEFVDAPHRVEEVVFDKSNEPEDKANSSTTDGSHLTWWKIIQDSSIKNSEILDPSSDTVAKLTSAKIYPGLEQSIDTIAKFINEKGPFDGLLGFSQGGGFAAILANTNHFNFKFVIICSAFVPCIPEFKIGDNYNTIPSLHVYGRDDSLMPPLFSQNLSSLFHNSISKEHKGGHFIPTDPESRKVFSKFFERFLNT